MAELAGQLRSKNQPDNSIPLVDDLSKLVTRQLTTMCAWMAQIAASENRQLPAEAEPLTLDVVLLSRCYRSPKRDELEIRASAGVSAGYRAERKIRPRLNRTNDAGSGTAGVTCTRTTMSW